MFHVQYVVAQEPDQSFYQEPEPHENDADPQHCYQTVFFLPFYLFFKTSNKTILQYCNCI
jgi:hypothetical protein